MENRVYVVPVRRDGRLVGWGIKFTDSPGESPIAVEFKTQKDAIAAAIESAKEMKAELRVQSRRGKWRIANSYGNDPNPPKG